MGNNIINFNLFFLSFTALYIQISKIIGIQFSILSPEEIRKGSVAEITTRDTYVNNIPIIKETKNGKHKHINTKYVFI